MIDPTHTVPLGSYRHNELLREAEHARLVRLAREGRSPRRRQGPRFRLLTVVARLLALGAVQPARR